MSWLDKFKDEVTNASFHLTLSSRMVMALGMCKAYSKCNDPIARMMGEKFNHFVPAVRSLINRGLVEHHPLPEKIREMKEPERSFAQAKYVWYTLTPAGEHVYQMCILAGLIPQELEKELAA